MPRKTASMDTAAGPRPINLSAYYNEVNDPAIQADRDEITARTDAFVAAYKGKVALLTPNQMAEAFEELDAIRAIEAKSAFGDVRSAMDTEDKAAQALDNQNSTFLSETRSKRAFYSIEISRIPAADLETAMQASPALARYRPEIEETIKFGPYLMTEEAEKVANVMHNTGAGGWATFFTRLMSQQTYSFNGRRISQSKLMDKMSLPDRATREKAFKAFTKNLAKLAFETTYITNMIVQSKRDMDQLRGYPSAVSERNLSNNIEDDVVAALNTAINENYHRLSHRYYALKAEYLGLPHLEPWDRNAPVSEDKGKISWRESVQMVKDTYKAFSPEMGAIAEEVFDNDWLDATDRPNKADGAFAHPGSVLAHPILFINWQGSRRDVATLFHEMGHIIHQRMAAQNTRSQMLSGTPLTLAETASVFGEKLGFERMLAAEKDPSKRVAMRFGKMDDMVNTVMRQNTFYNYELGIHNMMRQENRPLTTMEISEIYVQAHKEALGPAMKIDERSDMLWSYIPHVIHTPFYVLAYAFGDCLVNALHRSYQEATDKEAWEKKYTDMLKSGGTKHHKALLAPFGIDLTNPASWYKAMDVFAEDIDQLENDMKADRLLKQGSPQSSPSPM